MITNDKRQLVTKHIDNVRTLEQLGATVPKQWHEIAARYEEARGAISETLTHLTTEYITTGKKPGVPVPVAVRLALVDTGATPADVAPVAQTFATAALNALRAAYAPVAASNYEHFATTFNTVAAEFAQVAQAGLLTADEAITLPPTEQEEWMRAANLAQDLTEHETHLLAAAALAGGKAARRADRLGWVITGGPATARRRVWENIDSPGRLNKWGLFAKLGVPISAPDTLNDWETYREPEPLYTMTIKAEFGHRTVQIDPELEQTEEEQINRFKRQLEQV